MRDTASLRETPEVPVTKVRTIRVDDQLWLEAQRIASERRETISAVLKRALMDYVESHGGVVTP